MKVMKTFWGHITTTPAWKIGFAVLGFIVLSVLYMYIRHGQEFIQHPWNRLVVILILAAVLALYAYWAEKKKARPKKELKNKTRK
jgi:type VI protein secretion system component VasK